MAIEANNPPQKFCPYGARLIYLGSFVTDMLPLRGIVELPCIVCYRHVALPGIVGTYYMDIDPLIL